MESCLFGVWIGDAAVVGSGWSCLGLVAKASRPTAPAASSCCRCPAPRGGDAQPGMPSCPPWTCWPQCDAWWRVGELGVEAIVHANGAAGNAVSRNARGGGEGKGS